MLSIDGVTTNIVGQYATLAAALDAVKEGELVEVLADNSETITVTKTCAFTFKSNGHALGSAPTCAAGWKFVKSGDICSYEPIPFETENADGETVYFETIDAAYEASKSNATIRIRGTGTYTMHVGTSLSPLKKTALLDVGSATLNYNEYNLGGTSSDLVPPWWVETVHIGKNGKLAIVTGYGQSASTTCNCNFTSTDETAVLQYSSYGNGLTGDNTLFLGTMIVDAGVPMHIGSDKALPKNVTVNGQIELGCNLTMAADSVVTGTGKIGVLRDCDATVDGDFTGFTGTFGATSSNGDGIMRFAAAATFPETGIAIVGHQPDWPNSNLTARFEIDPSFAGIVNAASGRIFLNGNTAAKLGGATSGDREYVFGSYGAATEGDLTVALSEANVIGTFGSHTNSVYYFSVAGQGQTLDGNATLTATNIDFTASSYNGVWGAAPGASVSGDVTMTLESGTGGDFVGSLNAKVTGTTALTVNGGTIGGLYGTFNPVTSGSGDVALTVNGGTVGGIYAVNLNSGYNHSATVGKVGDVTISVLGGTVTGGIRGGNRSAVDGIDWTGFRADSVTINLGGGTGTANINAKVYGTSSLGVDGDITVNVKDGAVVTKDIYAGSKYVSTTGKTVVNVTGGTVGGKIYGGSDGSSGASASAEVNVSGGAVTGTIYANGASGDTISGDAVVNVSGGSVADLAVAAGTVNGRTGVNVTGGAVTGSITNYDAVLIAADLAMGTGKTICCGAFTNRNVLTMALGAAPAITVGSDFVNTGSIVFDLTNAAADGMIPLVRNDSAAAMTVDDYGAITLAGASGYTTVVSGNDLYAVKKVCRIGEKIYSSLAAAMDEAVDGDTITLLDDLEIEGTIASTGVGFTLDGDGYTITQSGAMPDHFLNLGTQSAGGSDFVLKNVVFDGIKVSNWLCRIEGCGTAKLDGVTFRNCSGLDIVHFTDVSAALTNCQFIANTATNLVIDFNTQAGDPNAALGTSVTVDDCLFADNAVAGHGVIYSYGPAGDIRNSTFWGNEIDNASAAVVYLSGTCNVTSNAFAENTTAVGGTKEAIVVVGSSALNASVVGNAFISHAFEGSGSHVLVNVGAAGCKLDGNYWMDGQLPEAGVDYSEKAGKEPTYGDFGSRYTLVNGTESDYALAPFGAAVKAVITNYTSGVINEDTGKVMPASDLADAIAEASSGDVVTTDEVTIEEDVDKELIILRDSSSSVNIIPGEGLVTTNSGTDITVVGRDVDNMTTVVQERKTEVVETTRPAEVATDDWDRLNGLASGVVQLEVAEQICDNALTNLVQDALERKDEVGIAADAEAVIIKVNVKVMPVDIQSDSEGDTKCAYDVTPEVRVGVVAAGNITNFIEATELEKDDFKANAVFQVTLPAGNMDPQWLVHKADTGDEYFIRGTGDKGTGTFAYDAASGKVSVWVDCNSVFEIYSALPSGIVVSFDALGGTFANGSDATNCTYVGGATYGDMPVPSRAGYTLVGWFDGVTTSAGEILSTDAISKTRLFAKWTVEDTATFADAFGGAAQDAFSATNVKAKAVIAKSDLVMPDRLADGRAVVEIARHAFRAADAGGAYAGTVTGVALGAFVKYVRPYAFYGQSLTNLTLPVAHDYLTGGKITLYIKDRAFEGTDLKTLVFPAGGTYELGQNAFSGIGGLEEVYCYGDLNLRSWRLSPFRHVGEGLAAGKVVKFHLKPSQAADAEFVRALTNGVDSACVQLDQEVLGNAEYENVVVGDTTITLEFSLDSGSPWQTVTQSNIYMLYSDDSEDVYVGTGKVAQPTSFADLGNGAYRATFAKPAGFDQGYLRICVGD